MLDRQRCFNFLCHADIEMEVHFNNNNKEIPSNHLPKGYYENAKKNQQMLQNLAQNRREVEAGTNNESVRNITRKRNNVWTPKTAKNKANGLASELYGSATKEGGKKKRKSSVKKTNRRKKRSV